MAISKLLHKDGPGDPFYSKMYIKEKGITKIPAEKIKGSRFNSLFHNVGGTYYLSLILLEYIDTHK